MRDDAPTFAMAVEFGRIAFPYLLFISLASLYGGVLNSIDRFAHVAATPILLNLTLIGAVLGLTPFLPNGGYAASIGVAVAGLLQWLWLLVVCARHEVGMTLVRPRWTARVARLVTLATPVAIGGGVQQISGMLDVVWASLLPVGTISALYYADRIAQLPLGVVGIAIGTALLPLLARQLRAGQAESAMANQNRAIEFGLLFSLPAAVALWLLSEPIIRVLFERGRFGPEDTLRTAGALAAFAVGLPAFVLVKALHPRLLRARGHPHAAHHRRRLDRGECRAEPALPLRHHARPGRHCARHLAVGLAERSPARRGSAPPRSLDRRPAARGASAAHARRHGRHGHRALAGAHPAGASRGAGQRQGRVGVRRHSACSAAPSTRHSARCWASCACRRCAS